MVEVVKRRPGRPRNVEVIASEGETPATVVKPVPDPEHDPNPVVEPVMSPREIEAAKNPPVFPDNGAHVEIAEPEPEPEVVLTPQQVVALDRDFDGDAGGSRPVAKLTELQRDAFAQDVIDAYEGQLEVRRGDAFNRVWTFRHETVKNMDHMLIECRRGPTVAQRLISTSVFSKGQAMVAIEGVDEETAR